MVFLAGKLWKQAVATYTNFYFGFRNNSDWFVNSPKEFSNFCYSTPDYRVAVVGMCSALTEASLHIFVTEWTPTLNHAKGSIAAKDLPYGYIFAIFMVRVEQSVISISISKLGF